MLSTPILFIIFNRPETTKKVFEAICKAQPKCLFIAADGPRSSIPGEKERCEQAREIVKQINWDCELFTLFRNDNLGCGKAVSNAISWFFEHVEEGIILEDDTLPHDSFFSYCELMLNRYRDNDKVMHVAAVNYQDGIIRGNGSYYFSKYPHIWGWATWKKAWLKYDFYLSDWHEIQNSEKFHSWCMNQQEQLFWGNIFNNVYLGNVDTWDYQWVYTIMKHYWFCIMPNQNLVKNIGFGAGATHTINVNNKLAELPIFEYSIPDQLAADVIDESADIYTYNNIFDPIYKSQSLVSKVKSKAFLLLDVVKERMFK